MRYLPLLLCLFTPLAWGTDKQNVYIGETKQGRLFVCDTPEQMSSIIRMHNEQGLEAAQRLAKDLGNTPGNGGAACGNAEGYFMLMRVLWEGDLAGADTALVEFAFFTMTGMIVPEPVYGILQNIRVVPADEADKQRL